MNINAYVSGWVVVDYHTEVVSTTIDEPIAGQNGKRLALIGYSHTSGDTTVADIMSIMHCGSSSGSRNTTSAIAISGQKDIVCTNVPLSPAGDTAASADIIAFQLEDDSWEWDTVASVSGSTITCTNNITGVDAGAGATAIKSGGRVLVFGIVADGAVLNQVMGVSTATVSRYDGIYALAPFKGDPLYVSIDNANEASKLQNMVFAYINK